MFGDQVPKQFGRISCATDLVGDVSEQIRGLKRKSVNILVANGQPEGQ